METTATFKGPDRLQPEEPVNFRAAIGSYYRDFPDDMPRDSEQWLKDLRDSESDVLGH